VYLFGVSYRRIDDDFEYQIGRAWERANQHEPVDERRVIESANELRITIQILHIFHQVLFGYIDVE